MSESAALRTLPRSFLYVPGDRLDLVEKAAGGEADAVLLDLEDAVAPESRAGARATVATWLASAPHGTPQWWVRVDGEALADDLPAAASDHVAGLVVAKSTPAALHEAAALLDELEAQRDLTPGSIGLVGLVESAAAFGALHEMARAPRVLTLALGEADLFGDLRLTRGPATEVAIDSLRLQLVLACAAAGLAAPVAPTSTAYRDLESFTTTSAGLRDLGFRSRTAVHPAQVPVINETFTPGQDEVDRAREALEAYEASGGAVTSANGHLVDAATVKASREVVARARLGS